MSIAPSRLRRAADPSPDARRRVRPTAAPPSLRVVPEAPKPRRLGRRLLIVATVLAVLAVPFALVLVHVELTAEELRLTSLQTRGDTAQSQYEKLRLQVAQLESPSRVVADAQQLGMVTPTSISYLTPAPVAVPNSAPTSSGVAAGPGVGDWSAAKRVDAGR